MAEPETVALVIKNPSRGDNVHRLVARVDTTVQDVKERIAAEYEGRPDPAQQTLIYAGKVLKDSAKLRDIVKPPYTPDVPHSIHLVIKKPAPADPGVARRAPDAQDVQNGTLRAAGSSAPAAAAAAGSNGPTARPGPLSGADWTTQFDSTRWHQQLQMAGRSAASSSGGQASSSRAAEHSAPPAAGNGPAGSAPVPAGPSSSSSSRPPLPPFNLGYMSHPGLAGLGPAHPFLAGALGPRPMPAGNLVGMQPHVMAAAYQAAYQAALTVTQAYSLHGAGPSSTAGTLAPSSSSMPPGAAAGMSAAAAGSSSTPMSAGFPAAAASSAALAANGPAAAAHASSSAPASAAGPSSSAAAGAAAAAAAANVAATSAPAALAPVVPVAPVFTPAIALYYPALQQQQQQGDGGLQQGAAAGAAVAPLPVPGPMGVLPWPVLGPLPVAQPAPPSSSGQLPQGVRHRIAHRLNVPRFAPAGGGGAPAPQHGAPGGAAEPAAAGGGGAPHRRYRTRTITFRISVRTLLQGLVLGIVLYQHCTWSRLFTLLGLTLLLYLTSLWTPLREFIRALAAGPRALGLQQGEGPPAADRAAAPAAAAAAAGAAPAAQGPGAAAAAAPAAPAGPHGRPGSAGGAPVPRGGLLWEVLTVLVGFITSLLPGWNYNAEDAAVFAAAQEMVAQEAARQQQDQQRQQQQQQQEEGQDDEQ